MLPVGGRGYPEHEWHVSHQWRMGVLSLSFIFRDYFKDAQKPLKSCIFIVGMFYNSYIHFWNITKKFSVYNITQ